jgi:UDP-2,4-diacetamido-2,4,6-trideoxy-beta-L-altropyranose hydrolase
MRVAIRVDASHVIGTGHFMRCLTLADALKLRGSQICFLSRNLPEYLRSMLTIEGHEFRPLNGGSIEDANTDGLFHSSWLGVSQKADARATIEALSDRSWDWLIADHYSLDAKWESALRHTAKNILVIDDIADREHDCDILLDQNFYSDLYVRYRGKVPSHCQLLLGPRYALLREEFRKLSVQAQVHVGTVKRVLIFFGGMDADNYTGRAIEAFAKIDMPTIHVDVVIGDQHKCREQIQIQCRRYGFWCHVQTSRMAELMASADLAIGAGGAAMWERCCLGLPTLAVCIAQNQRQQVVDAALAGLIYVPEDEDDFMEIISRHAWALIKNTHLRQLISNNCLQVVDGRGVSRVSSALEGYGIQIRIAESADSKRLYEWRNHPDIRSVSRNTKPITWEEHNRWFSAALASADKIVLIGHHEELPVGVVRFDMHGDEAEVSIYLVPDNPLYGQGHGLLLSAERWLAINRPTVLKINAFVLDDNKRSQYLFLGADYQLKSTHYSKRIK